MNKYSEEVINKINYIRNSREYFFQFNYDIINNNYQRLNDDIPWN